MGSRMGKMGPDRRVTIKIPESIVEKTGTYLIDFSLFNGGLVRQLQIGDIVNNNVDSGLEFSDRGGH